MRIAIVANGEWDYEWGKRELASFDRLVAADGGGNLILEAGYIPYVLIGDLDSIRPENLEKCRAHGTCIEQFPCEKDETDLELALEYAVNRWKCLENLDGNSLGANRQDAEGESQEALKDIWLLGATGGRVDHLLGNFAIMIGFLKRGYRIRAKDPYHELWLIRGKERIRGEKGQELSLVPISEYAIVRTEGLYYPLNKETLRQDSPRGISNVFLGEDALVDVSEGIVLAVLLDIKNRR